VNDAPTLSLYASQVRALASELATSIPEGTWRGPAHLECALRVTEIQHDLGAVARSLEIMAGESP
jgi:hypothetical protein